MTSTRKVLLIGALVLGASAQFSTFLRVNARQSTPVPARSQFGTYAPDCEHLYNGTDEEWARCMGVPYITN